MVLMLQLLPKQQLKLSSLQDALSVMIPKSLRFHLQNLQVSHSGHD